MAENVIRVSDYIRPGVAPPEEVSIPLSVVRGAATRDRTYNLWGLVVGVVVVLIGAYLILAGVTGGETIIRIPIPGQDDPAELHTSIPGVVFAAFGVIIIWITRPTVTEDGGT
jgi:hypothetical protein